MGRLEQERKRLLERRGRKVEPEAQSDEKIDVYEYFLDGTFPRLYTIRGIKLPYMNLTQSELQELKQSDSSPENQVIRMIAKAIHYYVKKQVENVDDYLLYPDKSMVENARALLNGLPSTIRQDFIRGIIMVENTRIQFILDLFEQNAEKPMETETYGVKRKLNVIDGFLHPNYVIKDTPYRITDIADMTMVQFYAISMSDREIAIRKANDHKVHHEKNKAKTGPSTKKKTYVGG